MKPLISWDKEEGEQQQRQNNNNNEELDKASTSVNTMYLRTAIGMHKNHKNIIQTKQKNEGLEGGGERSELTISTRATLPSETFFFTPPIFPPPPPPSFVCLNVLVFLHCRSIKRINAANCSFKCLSTLYINLENVPQLSQQHCSGLSTVFHHVANRVSGGEAVVWDEGKPVKNVFVYSVYPVWRRFFVSFFFFFFS